MRRAGRTAVWLLAAAGALQLLITVTPVLRWWTGYLTGPAWDAPAGDTLIVLGAEEDNPGGTLGFGTYWRCHAAVWAWRKGHYRRAIVSGGSGISDSMADYLVSHGVPREAVLRESEATTTRENALFAARMAREAGAAKVDLVTSDYHMRRSAAAFRRAGLAPRCVPAPDAGKRLHNRLERWSVFLLLCNETAKLAWYTARGWT